MNKNHPSSNSKSVRNSDKDSKLHKMHNPSSRFYRVDNPSSSQQAKTVIIPPQNQTQTPKHLQPKLKALSKWYKSPTSAQTTKLYNTNSKLQNLQHQAPSSKSIINHQTQLKLPKLDNINSKLQTPKPTTPSSKLQKWQQPSS